jgi:hypothetical protein
MICPCLKMFYDELSAGLRAAGVWEGCDGLRRMFGRIWVITDLVGLRGFGSWPWTA